MASTPPVNYTTISRIARTRMSLIERCLREGEAYSTVAINSPTEDGVTTQLNLGTTSLPRICKTIVINSITASCDKDIDGQVVVGGLNNVPQFVWRGFIKGGQCQIISFPEGLVIPGWAQNTIAFTRRLLTLQSNGTVLNGVLTVSGYRITDDFNYDADKTILCIGDSILNGTGPTSTQKSYMVMLADYIRSNGTNCRLVNMSVSGSTSANWEEMIDGGRIDTLDAADVIFYAVGVNDAGASVSASTYRARLEKFWARVQWKYPRALVVLLGATPVENNTTHTNAEALRAEMADMVADVGSARLKYIDLSPSFTRTDSTKYSSSDSAGSRVHPNDDGNDLIATQIKAQWDAQSLQGFLT